MEWTVVYLNDDVRAEVEALAVDLRGKFQRIVELVRSKGLEQVREPYIKHLEDKLWEMRLIGRDNIARIIYVTASGRRVVVLHAFIKKSDRTPRRALAIARARAKEIT
jgi:phage-related protein